MYSPIFSVFFFGSSWEEEEKPSAGDCCIFLDHFFNKYWIEKGMKTLKKYKIAIKINKNLRNPITCFAFAIHPKSK